MELSRSFDLIETAHKKQNYYLFTSESVTEGHPDKMADVIASTILDEVLLQDDRGRVGVEVLLTKDRVVMGGEITTTAMVDYDTLVRDVVREIGYTRAAEGFSAEKLIVENRIQRQSPDIALGVDRDGAGDSGIVFGGACDETAQCMGIAHMLAREITIALTRNVKENTNSLLRPDGKAQVTYRHDVINHAPMSLDNIVVSCMHTDVSLDKVREYIREQILRPVLVENGLGLRDVNKIFINSTGRFVLGGPAADTGLTGRKIVVDTYGGRFPVGGGSLVGKDPTKMDVSAALMARYVCKNIVALGIAKKAGLQLAYSIAMQNPTSIFLDTYKTKKYPVATIARAIKDTFDLRPVGIREMLRLTAGGFRYADAVKTGFFGNKYHEFPWEATDKADALLRFCVADYRQQGQD